MTAPAANAPRATRLARTRRQVWGGVALLALLAGAAWGLRPGRKAPAPAAPTEIRVAVLGATGAPETRARVYLLQRADQAAQGTWDPAAAVFRLPVAATPARALVGAPGHRLGEVRELARDQSVKLRPGIEVRIRLEGRELLEVDGHRLLLRIRPAVDPEGRLPGAGHVEAADLVAFMEPLEPPPAALEPLTRAEFGLALTAAQAEAGVRLPAAGRYAVHWGVLAPGAGTWFTLEDRTGKVLGVRDREAPQVFALRITPEGAAQTLAGLQEWVARLGAPAAAR